MIRPGSAGGVARWRPVVLALGLAAGPLVAMGMARFAYALLLPPMRADLQWSYTQAGAMNTANAVGYLVGAIGSAWLVTRLRLRLLFLVALTLTAASVVACSATASFTLLAVLRLLGGACGAVTFVAGAALVMHAGAHLPGRFATLLLGIYVAGGGLGIAVSGIVVPPLVADVGPGWRLGWLVLGVVSVVALLPATLAARGVGDTAQSAVLDVAAWPWRRLTALAVAYLLFGLGYAGYTTFIVALLQPRLGPAVVAVFWVVLGLAAAISAVTWGPLLGRFRGGRGLAVLLGMTAVGAAVPVVADGPGGAVTSAILFGGAFVATAAAVTAVVRDAAPPHAWGRAVGALTTGFAAGQCVGPVLTGALSDQSGVRAGMAVSAALLAVGAVVALAQPSSVKNGNA
jgi:predicted MFS family arabinose efflux permease